MADWKQNRDARRAAYVQKLKDPRWQKIRLEVFQRDSFTCQRCFDTETTLNVHHFWYEDGKEPWEYPLSALVTLCEDCHASETEARPDEERLLLQTLRKCRFFAEDILDIARGFSFLDEYPHPEVLSGAIEWALSHPERVGQIVGAWEAELKRRNARHDGSDEGAPE